MFRKKSQPGILAAVCLVSLVTVANPISLPALAGKSAEGLPGRRVGAGSRGCGAQNQTGFVNPKQLIALVPQNNLGTTVATQPTLFFHLPQLPAAQTIEFVLQDDREEQIYETTFLTPANQAGVVSVNLSKSTSKLEVGKRYRWYFSMICNAEERSSDIVVDGWIERVELAPALAQRLQKVSPEAKADLYISSGLWQEALATLAELRRERPQDSAIAARWTKLLQSFGLNEIAKAPILGNQLLANITANNIDKR